MVFSFEVSAELECEINDQKLAVSGEIPHWLSGTLIRNGPITVSVNGKSPAHWFDGLAMLHAFSFQEGKVKYSNKFLRTDAYHKVFEEGSLHYDGFAIDPCRSLFKWFFTLFSPHHPDLHNANVNVAKLADAYVALTEIPLPVKFDPKTLDTLGVFNYHDRLPKEKCWESAHPHYDDKRKETLNYLIQFGRKSSYLLHRMTEGQKERSIISEISVDRPSYMHSFAITEKYAIFTEFPFVVKPFDLITKGKAFIKNYSWLPERGTHFLLVNRLNGNLIGRYATKPFFAFHHVNAFEEGDKIHLDLVAYDDVSVIQGFMNFSKEVNIRTRLERFSLSLKADEITSQVLFPHTIEFPRINNTFDGNPYRYVYAAGFSDNISNKEQLLKSKALYKIDTTKEKVLIWSEKGCSPGEPVFVPSPHSLEEDDGVILTVVLDSIHNGSFLLILDGKTFKEIGRAKAPHPVPPGLHGQYFQ